MKSKGCYSQTNDKVLVNVLTIAGVISFASAVIYAWPALAHIGQHFF